MSSTIPWVPTSRPILSRKMIVAMSRSAGLRWASAAALAIGVAAAPAQAGPLEARGHGDQVAFVQPGAPGATLRVVGTEPAGVTTRVQRVGGGLMRLSLRAPAGTTHTSVRFERVSGERFLGFGERSDAVVRTAGTVQNRVTEGPYQDVEQPLIAAFVPAPGLNTRHDATYFPIPWLISTRGFGVLVENDPTSTEQLGSPWSIDIEGDRLDLLVVAGPTPRAVLRRFSEHVGRQPAAPAAALGPWWQPPAGASDEAAIATLRRARALGSVVQTFTHYLPCGAQNSAAERERVAAFHRAGLLTTTYFNPMVCTSHPLYGEMRDRGLLTQNALGQPYEYRYTGTSVFLVGQLDFRAPGTVDMWRRLTGEALADGHSGWMEDFGEYTPDDARAHDGTTGSAGHNAYVRDYHAAAQRAAGSRRLLRFVRSGWTGSAKSSPIVWGGDPTTDWGFDGLQSAVRNGLSMGLSGVSRWGSDIGGYFALSARQTTPELLRRWIEVGFASGVMRTEANGFGLGQASGPRAQITDADVLPTWARYARLRTRLLPELQRAEREYARSGLPVMRQLALTYPSDRRAVARDDEWLLGSKLLVAPVLSPGQTERTAYLPKGRWIDLWRSADAGLRRLRTVRILRGGCDVTLPAPADELPLLVREGARLELLPTDGPAWRDAVAAGQRRRSIIAFEGRRIRLSGPRARRYDIQWALPRRPHAVRVGRRRVAFGFSGGVLRLTVMARRATVAVS